MTDFTPYTEALEALRATVRADLEQIAVENPTTGDWEVRPDTTVHDEADENALADNAEEADLRVATLNELETRYRNITRALEKIADGTYGICELSGEPIEHDRLMANPAARTCKAHMNEETQLPL